MQLTLKGLESEASQHLRVLLIEKSSEEAERSLCMLRKGGISPLSVRVDTREGFLKQVSAGKWDVILSNCCLPEFHPMEALELLKQQGVEIPLIVLADQVDEGTAIECLHHGAARYLPKHRLTRLAAVVHQVLTQERLRCERDETIAALRRSEESYRTLLEAMPYLVVSVDSNNRIVMLNREAEAVTGYERSELIGKTWREAFLPDAARLEEMNGVLDRILGCNASLQVRSPIRTKDGRERLIEWSGTSINDETGRPQGAIAVGRDVTDEVRLEEVRARMDKMAAVGQLASGVAHEFRNIMGAVLLQVRLAQRAECSEGARRALERIAELSKRAQTFTDELLALARPSRAHRAVTDICRCVRGTVELIGPEMHQRGIAVYTSMDPGTPPVLCDPGQIQQAILNLLLNARDAMPHGGILSVSVHPVHDSEDSCPSVDISISDTGVGIAEENVPRIFEPFFTTKKCTCRPENSGAGLGLSLVLRIIEAHGGQVYVDTQAGKGTVMTVRLPAANQSLSENALDEAPPAQVQAIPPLDILVADDEPAIREGIAELLALDNHRVVQAANGKEAIEAMRTRHFDLVLCDLAMPEVGGEEVLQAARAQQFPPQVVLMTGRGDPQVSSAVANGALACVQKPFEIDEVLQLLPRRSRSTGQSQ